MFVYVHVHVVVYLLNYLLLLLICEGMERHCWWIVILQVELLLQ